MPSTTWLKGGRRVLHHHKEETEAQGTCGGMLGRAGDTGSSWDWRLVIRVREKGCRSPAVLCFVGREDLVDFYYYYFFMHFNL